MPATRPQRQRVAIVALVLLAAIIAVVMFGMSSMSGRTTPAGWEQTKWVGLLKFLEIESVEPAGGLAPTESTWSWSIPRLALTIAIAALPILVGGLIARAHVRSSRLPRELCDECAHPIGPSSSERCPECGAPTTPEAVRPFDRALLRVVSGLAVVIALTLGGLLIYALWTPHVTSTGRMNGELISETTRYGIFGWRTRSLNRPPGATDLVETVRENHIALVTSIAVTASLVALPLVGALLARRRRRRTRASEQPACD